MIGPVRALRLCAISFVLLLSGASTTAAPTWRVEPARLLAAAQWEEARDAYTSALADHPKDPEAMYGLAVALAQLGDVDGADAELVAAIGVGFVDFHRFERDGRLDPLRQTPKFRTILGGWRALLDARADVNEKALRRFLGRGGTIVRDERLRLIYASAWQPRSFELAQREITGVADWAYATLFEEPAPDDPRPDPWVSVILPTPERFEKMMIALGAGPNVGGLYDNDRGQLICRDLGPSLRHEFLHVLHWRLLSRVNQRHPDWIMEGLGTLIEDADPDEAAPGGMRPVPSWRTNIAKRLLDRGRLMPLADLIAMDRRAFRSRRPNANYAQARAIMLYLYDRGDLSAFFHTYVRTSAQDATGRAALESVLGAPLDEIETGYRAWLGALPMVAEEIRPGMASLGVVVGAGRGDGPVIERIPLGSNAASAGLRLGDVILTIDGRSTRTLLDLVRVLASYSVGEEVVLMVRRGRLLIEVSVRLTEQEGRK